MSNRPISQYPTAFSWLTSQPDGKRFKDTWNGVSASPLSSSQRVLGEIQIAVPLVEKATLPGVGTNGVVDPTLPLLLLVAALMI